MPFTPAHPLILYPLRFLPVKYFSVTALIIGSIVPDMEYFLKLNAAAVFSHSVKGIFLFNLPVTILIAWLWHSGVKNALIYIPLLKDKYYRIQDVSFRKLFTSAPAVFLISALIGITSHIVLDGFTHPRGYFARRSPFLLDFVSVAGMKLRMCYLLWYIASIAGTAIVLVNLIDFKKFRAIFRMTDEGKNFWLQTLFLAAVLSIIRIAGGLSWNTYRHLVIIAIGSGLYAFFTIALITKKKKSIVDQ